MLLNRTFSVEHDASGKRSFLVSSYDGFWHRYRDMLPDHRHYYEIIQDSYPCHLYFGTHPCSPLLTLPPHHSPLSTCNSLTLGPVAACLLSKMHVYLDCMYDTSTLQVRCYVIAAGHNRKQNMCCCRLAFFSTSFSADLEFQKGCNEAVDGVKMVDRLLELVAQQLKVSSHLHAVRPLFCSACCIQSINAHATLTAD